MRRLSRAPAGTPTVEIDFHAGKLSARLPSSSGWVPLTTAGAPARYHADVPGQSVAIEFETVNGIVTGVVVDPGAGNPRLTLMRMR